MNFCTALGKNVTCQETLRNVFDKSLKKYFSKNSPDDIDESSENFRHSWSKHMMKCLPTGLARAVPGFTRP